MSKHTPGPWTVLEFPDEKFVEVRANEGYSIVAHVFFNNGNRDETARLIAAAPDYHEAAIAILKAHDEDAVRSNFARCGCGVCSDLRPIVAKATGE